MAGWSKPLSFALRFMIFKPRVQGQRQRTDDAEVPTPVPFVRSVMRELEQHLMMTVHENVAALHSLGHRAARFTAVLPRAASGVPHARLRAWRVSGSTTCATPLWRSRSRVGPIPQEVTTWTGHSSVAFILDRYGHLYEENGDDVTDRMDALIVQSQRSTGAAV